jgi:hypothetical protein
MGKIPDVNPHFHSDLLQRRQNITEENIMPNIAVG